jgi:hypothetical protein
MVVEFEGKRYESVIGEEITEGDLYFDCIEHSVKVCDQYICFLPWGLKLKEVENEKN